MDKPIVYLDELEKLDAKLNKILQILESNPVPSLDDCQHIWVWEGEFGGISCVNCGENG